MQLSENKEKGSIFQGKELHLLKACSKFSGSIMHTNLQISGILLRLYSQYPSFRGYGMLTTQDKIYSSTQTDSGLQI